MSLKYNSFNIENPMIPFNMPAIYKKGTSEFNVLRIVYNGNVVFDTEGSTSIELRDPPDPGWSAFQPHLSTGEDYEIQNTSFNALECISRYSGGWYFLFDYSQMPVSLSPYIIGVIYVWNTVSNIIERLNITEQLEHYNNGLDQNIWYHYFRGIGPILGAELEVGYL